MNPTCKLSQNQKLSLKLCLDLKLMTSLQILQMPVKDLELFLEEKLILNPLIPLEKLKSKELLLGDFGIIADNIAADPEAEERFWETLFHAENMPGNDSFEDISLPVSPTKKMNFSILKKGCEREIDLFLFLEGSNWKVASFQPFLSLIEKAILTEKTAQKNTPFFKELTSLQFALSSRRNLLLAIGKEIALSWNFIFQNKTIVPLDLLETANRLQRHRTTVFRAIKGKKLFTPEGIIPLESLFEGKRMKKRRIAKKIKASAKSS